ncbi:MAG: NADP-dependent oxidoreductase [Actinomycetota bacterium]|nr:NADP-dependent oxidoreductase [Actinomycetota bacterium]
MELPRPVLGPDYVLIRVAAAGVNPVDWKVREGRLVSRFPHHFPLILGWDVSGTVEDVGPAVTRFKPGDEVVAYARKSCVEFGTYAEYVTVLDEAVALAPRTTDLVAAGALPLAGLTAWQAITDALQVRAGEQVVVHGGSGGVGSFAVQLLVSLGAEALATASRANHDYLSNLGAKPLDRHADITEQVRALAPGGVDAVLDIAGGPDAVKASLPLLKDGGRVTSILKPPSLDDEGRRRGLMGRYIFVRPWGEQLSELVSRVDAGGLNIHLHGTYSLEDAAKAQEELQGGGVRGKLALVVEAKKR